MSLHVRLRNMGDKHAFVKESSKTTYMELLQQCRSVNNNWARFGQIAYVLQIYVARIDPGIIISPIAWLAKIISSNSNLCRLLLSYLQLFKSI